MNEVQRAILQEVAEGRLSPEEAAVLLDQAEKAEQEQGSEHDEPSEETGAATGERPRDHTTPPPAGTDTGIKRVRVVGNFRSARIVADPTVREAIAEGPHIARREGDLLIVESAFDEADMPGFVFNRGMRNWRLTIPPDFAGGRPGRPGRGRNGPGASPGSAARGAGTS